MSWFRFPLSWLGCWKLNLLLGWFSCQFYLAILWSPPLLNLGRRALAPFGVSFIISNQSYMSAMTSWRVHKWFRMLEIEFTFGWFSRQVDLAILWSPPLRNLGRRALAPFGGSFFISKPSYMSAKTSWRVHKWFRMLEIKFTLGWFSCQFDLAILWSPPLRNLGRQALAPFGGSFLISKQSYMSTKTSWRVHKW